MGLLYSLHAAWPFGLKNRYQRLLKFLQILIIDAKAHPNNAAIVRKMGSVAETLQKFCTWNHLPIPKEIGEAFQIEAAHGLGRFFR